MTSISYRRFHRLLYIGIIGSLTMFILSKFNFTISLNFSIIDNDDEAYRQRPECNCSRAKLPALTLPLSVQLNDSRLSLCSIYATRRGYQQRVISISLFGPKEIKRFEFNQTMNFLRLLIKDLNTIYSDRFLLRIHHDDTISTTDVVCPIECQHPNVDFCDMKEKLYIPPKIWRFIPAGDPLIDIMMSRDLDSALTKRERASVDVWLQSKKSFHVMRDHPMHGTAMLGGMWGFRPSLSPNISQIIHNKIHNEQLVKKYTHRADQPFLSHYVWPFAQLDAIVHDSFLCQHKFGSKTEPFPTQRISPNETDCFIGCVRPCCGKGKMPFKECPIECRPKNHPEWTYC